MSDILKSCQHGKLLYGKKVFGEGVHNIFKRKVKEFQSDTFPEQYIQRK